MVVGAISNVLATVITNWGSGDDWWTWTKKILISAAVGAAFGFLGRIASGLRLGGGLIAKLGLKLVGKLVVVAAAAASYWLEIELIGGTWSWPALLERCLAAAVAHSLSSRLAAMLWGSGGGWSLSFWAAAMDAGVTVVVATVLLYVRSILLGVAAVARSGRGPVAGSQSAASKALEATDPDSEEFDQALEEAAAGAPREIQEKPWWDW
jgi:hypothetical protein